MRPGGTTTICIGECADLLDTSYLFALEPGNNQGLIIVPTKEASVGGSGRGAPARHSHAGAWERAHSQALMVGLKDLIAISNGSACTSSSYTSSHVLTAMGLSDVEANSCVRVSWCHLTPPLDWESVADGVKNLL